MKLTNASAFTEKGHVKPAVRKSLVDYVANHPNLFAKAERVEDKAVFTLTVTDKDGKKVYVNFDVTVSDKHPTERAVKKSTHKKSVADAVEVE